MNEERIITLMMDALDGVLDESESAELESGLAANPTLAQEWEAMQTIDALLISTPPATQPINFAANTLSQLPNERNRRLFVSAFFLLLLIGGIMPILGGIALSSGFGGSFMQSLQLFGVISATITSGAFTLVFSQPVALALLTAMLCAILLWASVFRQYSNRVQPLLISS